MKKKISLLSNEKLDEKSYEKSKKYINEILQFNYFVIDSYRNDKNNFYKFFNFYYLFILEEDLKIQEKNILLKEFFGLHGFKTIINDLKNKNKKEIYRKREKNYNFENIYTLLQDEGLEEIIVDKMKLIIKEVKDRDDLKRKIYKFILESLDAFKDNIDKFLKVLNSILDQVKLNFKEMVKQKVGNTDDVKKFLQKKDCSCYIESNYKNNKYILDYENDNENNTFSKKTKKNYIYIKADENKNRNNKNEYDLYNGFKIKSYEPKNEYIYLDISNTFIANNNNNNYIKETEKNINKDNKISLTEIENIYIYEDSNKKDILKSLNNIDNFKEPTNIVVKVDTSNYIEANNNNNSAKSSSNFKLFENNNIEETLIINHNKKLEVKYESINQKITYFNDILNKEIKKKNNNEKKMFILIIIKIIMKK